MPLEQHPTDPDKLRYVRAEYNLTKPWVDLTDEEIGALIIGTLSADTNPAQTRPRDVKFARSVLATFKEKNT